MKDVHAAIAEALEARVSQGEMGGEVSGDWLYYSFAYAAHAAFMLGDNPIDAARTFVAELPADTDPRDVEALTFSLSLLEDVIARLTRGH